VASDAQAFPDDVYLITIYRRQRRRPPGPWPPAPGPFLMPTYDYVCDACNHEFELFQSITDPVKRKCPECGKSKLRRLIGTGAAIMFKGSGFYKTDYRSESYKKQAEADKSPGSSEGKSSDAKTESKASGSENKPAGAETKSPSSRPAKKRKH
jgi:putative FmdB family regulatory protein